MGRPKVLKINDERIFGKHIKTYSIHKDTMYYRYQDLGPEEDGIGSQILQTIDTFVALGQLATGLGGNRLFSPDNQFDYSVNWKDYEFKYLRLELYDGREYCYYSDPKLRELYHKLCELYQDNYSKDQDLFSKSDDFGSNTRRSVDDLNKVHSEYIYLREDTIETLMDKMDTIFDVI